MILQAGNGEAGVQDRARHGPGGSLGSPGRAHGCAASKKTAARAAVLGQMTTACVPPWLSGGADASLLWWRKEWLLVLIRL